MSDDIALVLRKTVRVGSSLATYHVRSLASNMGREAAYFPGVTPSALLKQRFK
jgi:hypothetical protein